MSQWIVEFVEFKCIIHSDPFCLLKLTTPVAIAATSLSAEDIALLRTIGTKIDLSSQYYALSRLNVMHFPKFFLIMHHSVCFLSYYVLKVSGHTVTNSLRPANKSSALFIVYTFIVVIPFDSTFASCCICIHSTNFLPDLPTSFAAAATVALSSPRDITLSVFAIFDTLENGKGPIGTCFAISN